MDALNGRAFSRSKLGEHKLAIVDYTTEPNFGLSIPTSAPNVPSNVLNPRETWSDQSAYDTQAKKLAGLFRENDTKYDLTDEVRSAGPNA